ncbi:MAG: BrnT family toxin [Azoarcus sp.]|jgi:uncharacterized DUF497 family protein|nr:BrnT family toxin [Azoarcus sp.]
MKIDFDPEKDAKNIKSHGVSLAKAANLAWEKAYCWLDERYPYDETRMRGLVPLDNILYHVVFVERNEFMRIISLRRAEPSEVKNYVQNYYDA